MSMLGTKQPTEYPDGRTKQSFKDETDINKLMQRAQKTGTISHLNKNEAHYGDFSGFDFFEAQLKLTAGRQMFDELPSEVRREFDQSPAEFFEFVNDPKNADKLGELLPALAAPGRQLLDVNGNVSADETKARVASETPPTPEPPATPVPDPSPGPDAPGEEFPPSE